MFKHQQSARHWNGSERLRSTHGIARMMSGDEVNVKFEDVARLHGLNTLQVVLELIAPTQVGVTVVILVRLLYGVFNGACDICAGTESAGLKGRLSRF